MPKRGYIRASVEITLPAVVDLSEIEEALRSNLEEIAHRVADKARQKVRRRTGKLARTIKVITLPHGFRVKAGSNKVRTAHLIEFGHDMVTKDGRTVGRVPAYPFLRPAKEEVINDVIAALAWSPASTRAGSFVGH